MKKTIKVFVIMVFATVLSTTVLYANSSRFTLRTSSWGGWGSPSSGVLKTDDNNGWFEKHDQSAWFDNFADAFYKGKRASNTYYNLSNPGPDGKNWFSFVGGQNAAFNDRYVQCRVASSNNDPNSGSVDITFAP